MKESAPQSKSTRQKRSTIFRRVSSGIAVVLAVAVTVSLVNSAHSVQAPVQGAPYDGVTLYRGLFFASGPVASKIPTIRKVAPYLPADYKNLESQIIKYIQAKDPSYFDRFANEIQSGDRVKVANAIVRTNKLQKEAVLEVTKGSKAQFASQVRRLNNPSMTRASDPEAENDANVAAAVEVWLALVVAIAGFIVVAFVLLKTKPAELKGLKYEQFVDEIVRAVPRARPSVLQP